MSIISYHVQMETYTNSDDNGFDLNYNPFNDESIKDLKIQLDLRSLKYLSSTRSLDHITCPICKLPFIEPWSTVCGHTFCKECIFESFKSVLGEKCPLDRVSLKSSSLIRNQIINDEFIQFDDININNDEQSTDSDIYPAPIIISNITDDLIVCCLNKSRGCSWTGERWSVKNHLIENCDYTRIKCKCGELCERELLVDNNLLKKSYTNGFEIVKAVYSEKVRNDDDDDNDGGVDIVDSDSNAYGGDFSDDEILSEHEFKGNNNIDLKSEIIETCPHSEIKCLDCDSLVRIMDLDNHLKKECLKNMIKCTGCHLSFPVMYFEKHQSTCQKIYINCPGTKYGCNWKGQRELLESIHLVDCSFIKISGYLEKLENKINELTDENENLKLQMSTILDSIVHGKVKNLGYSQDIEEISSGLTNVSFQSIINNDVNDSSVRSPNYLNDGKINYNKVKTLIEELEFNKSVTGALIEDNSSLREQLNNQRTMILNLQQQMQFIMIERRRSISQKNLVDMGQNKLTTKL